MYLVEDLNWCPELSHQAIVHTSVNLHVRTIEYEELRNVGDIHDRNLLPFENTGEMGWVEFGSSG